MKNMRTQLNQEDMELLDYFAKTRNIKQKTKKLYRITLSEYTTYYKTTLTKLFQEAEQEEENGTRWKKRTLKKRLIEYRVYLYQKHSKNTASHRFNRVKAFYEHFDIEIHSLPPFNKINIENTPAINYKNLPDKEIIRAAVDIASPVMKPVILFMVSSGCAKAETLNLTIMDYMKATYEYHQTHDINEMINKLNEIDDVVPTFHLKRQKTGKYFTTFCSPEAVHAINLYLTDRKDTLTPESKVFKINDDYFSVKFGEINDELGLGKVGAFRRFRSHMLRKFHASTLMNDGLSREIVNDLQGKSKNSVDEAYFFNSDESLRTEYIQHLHAVTISKEVEKVTVKSPEYVKLENKNKDLQEKVHQQQSKYDSLRKRIEALENKSDEDILNKFRYKK